MIEDVITRLADLKGSVDYLLTLEGAGGGGGVLPVPVRGDVLTGQVGPIWGTVAHPGAAAEFFRANAVDPGWAAIQAADLPAMGGVPGLTFTTVNAGGAAVTYVRTDASLAIFDANNPTSVDVGDGAVVGVAAFAARRDHQHAVNSSSNPGAAASLLASDASGYLRLTRIGINVAPTASVHADQSNAAGGIPAIIADQGDTNEQCVQYRSDGVDRDINLWTVGVTGTPTLFWDESEDSLTYTVATAHTATIADVVTIRHTSTGSVQNLFGLNLSFELEDNGGNIQPAAEITAMWTHAAVAARLPLLRFTTFPEGARGPGYSGFWTHAAVDANSKIVIRAGAGDVTGFFWARYVLVESGGGTATSTTVGGLAPGDPAYTLYTDGVDTFTLTVAAGGEVSVVRSVGASTADIALFMVWI